MELFLRELASVAAVEDVDQQAEAEPDHEAQPGDQGEAEHQATAEQRRKSAGTTAQTGRGRHACDRAACGGGRSLPAKPGRRQTACRCWRGRRRLRCRRGRREFRRRSRRSRWTSAASYISDAPRRIASAASRRGTWRTRCAPGRTETRASEEIMPVSAPITMTERKNGCTPRYFMA